MSKELCVLRTEKKYKLSVLEAERLFMKLGFIMKGDPFHGIKPYMVRSLYFDTVGNNDYWEKINGVESRKKIRLRIYNTEATEAKLELKEKQGKLQRKRSLSLSKEEAMALIGGKYEVLKEKENEFAQEMYCLMMTEGYRPVCMVEYQRKAYTHVTNDIRITFDSRIEANEGDFDLFSPRLSTYPVTPLDEVVMEVKYNGFLLSYIKDVVSLADRSEISSSKYCTARKYAFVN